MLALTKHPRTREILRYCCYAVFVIIVFLILYKLLMPRVNAFGCFDDCFNFMAGYFLLKGSTLYSEIFFNHQPLMAYISQAIQYVSDPVNIYELVLRHRQFVLLFGLVFSFLLLLRFGWIMGMFVLLYEFGKFYLFGDRFLAEALIVYPLVFLLGLLWEKMHGRRLGRGDYIFAAVLSWFVIFMREPYAPVGLIVYLFLLFGKPRVNRRLSLALFASLSTGTLLSLPIPSYFFQVVTVNHHVFFIEQTQGKSIHFLSVFFYPVAQFFYGEWNLFHLYLSGLSAIFLVSILFYAFTTKRYTVVMTFFFLLGLANLRASEPGTVFYAAFHMLVWFAMFVFLTLLCIRELMKHDTRFAKGVLAGFFLTFAFFILSPSSYLRETPDPHTEFITNYGKELQVGEAVRHISDPSDTLFLDGFDDLIYWQADRVSPYPYGWYTSVMPQFHVYREAKERMFTMNPPDFYYGSCPKESVNDRFMPGNARKIYTRLNQHGKASCLFVRNDILSKITEDQWEKASEVGYSLPEETLPR